LEQHRFDLVVKKIPGGVASNFMHGRKVGDTFEFSGPWGKYKPVEAMTDEKILCIATDTGVTAGLGLLRGKLLASLLSRAKFLWLVPSEDYFIPTRILDEWLPKDVDAIFPVFISSVGSIARIAASMIEVKKVIGLTRWTKIYLSGDGLILTELKNFFLNQGYGEEQIITETFFNHTSLKTATAG
jgi:NAD(P)H-flavin reductase